MSNFCHNFCHNFCRHPGTPWCRYADDGLAYSRTEQQSRQLFETLQKCFAQCGLELHPEKTKIVYCKDSNRRGRYHMTSFDFLGYTFKPRVSWSKRQHCPLVSFTPAVSTSLERDANKDEEEQLASHGISRGSSGYFFFLSLTGTLKINRCPKSNKDSGIKEFT